MNYRTGLLCSFLALVMLCFCGCATESNITRLSEQDILIQEQLAEEAREHYYCGQYDQMTQLEPVRHYIFVSLAQVIWQVMIKSPLKSICWMPTHQSRSSTIPPLKKPL